jgi:hypothetical protein
MMVESREDGQVEIAAPQGEPAAHADVPPRDHHPRGDREEDGLRQDTAVHGMSDSTEEDESLPQSPMTIQDGIRAVQQAFAQASPPPRWPMYVRQAKQFLKTRIDGFDERKYGFASVVDLLRAAGKEGVLKLERDRHGAFRVFAGSKLIAPQTRVDVDEPAIDVAAEVIAEEPFGEGEPIEEPPILDVQPVEAFAPVAADEEQPEAIEDVTPQVEQPTTKGARKRKTPSRSGQKPGGPKSNTVARGRSRKTARGKAAAADR